MKLKDKLDEIFKRKAPPKEGNEYGKEVDLKLNDNVIIEAKYRCYAKRRYLAYLVRKLVRQRMEKDHDDLELTDQILADIDEKVNVWKDRFSDIENLYKEVYSPEYIVDRLNLVEINDKIEENVRYMHPELKMNDPFTNRALFIWDIVWSLLAIYNDKELKPIFDSSVGTTENTKAREMFLDNIERRLRKIERMRYNVSTRLESEGYLGLDVPDGHTLRMFEYPCDFTWFLPEYRKARTEIKAKANTVWRYSTHPLLSKDNVLYGDGIENPLTAILNIFQPSHSDLDWEDPENRNIAYCDRVIHILHLEDLASYLKRKFGHSVANNKLKQLIDRISIVLSWRSDGNYIGTGINDPYFERLEKENEARMDKLIPGDHIYIRSHPAYVGVAKTFAWRLENVLVMRIEGTSIPGSIQVQGHGAGPYKLGKMQTHMTNEFVLGHKSFGQYSGGLLDAQRRIDLRRDEEIGLPELDTADKTIRRLLTVFNDGSPFGMKGSSGWPRTLLDVAKDYEQKGYPFIYGLKKQCPTQIEKAKYDTGIIEFRGEFSDWDIGAFWARWVHLCHKDRNQSKMAFENGDHIEFEDDAIIYPDLTDMPFVEEVEPDYDNKKLILKGLLFDKERIKGIYFVSETNRKLTFIDDEWRWVSDPPSESCLVEHGKSLMYDFPFEIGSEGKEMTIILDNDWNPVQHLWKPVLITSIGVEIRSESSFTWPTDGDLPETQIVNYFNTAYFPLFGTSNPESSSPKFDLRIRFDLIDNIDLYQQFYRENQPWQTIRVIRPRLKIEEDL